MREAMSYTAKSVSDHLHKELRPDEIFELFKDTFENVTTPYNINGVHFKQLDEGRIEAQVTSNYEGGEYATAYAEGNGRLNAVSNALKQQYNLQYDLVSYTEHALEQSSSAQAIAYVGIKKAGRNPFLGRRRRSGYHPCFHRRAGNCNQQPIRKERAYAV